MEVLPYILKKPESCNWWLKEMKLCKRMFSPNRLVLNLVIFMFFCVPSFKLCGRSIVSLCWQPLNSRIDLSESCTVSTLLNLNAKFIFPTSKSRGCGFKFQIFVDSYIFCYCHLDQFYHFRFQQLQFFNVYFWQILQGHRLYNALSTNAHNHSLLCSCHF